MNMDQSLFGIIDKMGVMGQFIAFLIFILSVIAVYVFIERLLFFKMINKAKSDFMDKIKEMLAEGNLQGAKEYCSRYNSPVSRVVLKGIQRIGAPQRDVEMAMEKQIGIEIYRFEKGEGLLSLISKMAPMLGFIGTIAGVIQIFYTINATGDYNIESISGGLYVKMITSALGLFLGVLSFFFYFIVSTKIKNSIFKLDQASSQFMDILSMPTR